MSIKINDNIKNYSYDLLDDWLFFSDTIDDDLELVRNMFLDIDYLKYLDYHISTIIKESIYPHEIKDNINKLMIFIGKIMNESKVSNIEELKNIYYQIYGRYCLNDFDNSYDIYYTEFTKKFNNLEMYLKNDQQLISKQTLIESIRMDFIIFRAYSLNNDDYLSVLNSFVGNQYYLMAINKFLSDVPYLFFDESIKKRTLGVLNYNVALLEENNNVEDENIQSTLKENNKLINRINRLNKKNLDQNFDIGDFKEYYKLILMKRVINTNEQIEISEYKDLVTTKYFLAYIEQFVNKSSSLISDIGRNRIFHLLDLILEKFSNNEMKKQINELKYQLNELKVENDIEISLYEFSYRYELKEKIKNTFENILYGTDDLNFQINGLMQYDFDVIKSYLVDDDKFNQLLESRFFCDERLNYSLRLFLKEYPSLFSEPKIMERTMLILNKNIELCTDEMKQKQFMKENKYSIRQTEKIKNKIEKIKG